MRDEYMLKCLAVVAIAVLAAIAMLQGIDGLYFATVMTILGAVFGIKFKEDVLEFYKKIKKGKGKSNQP